MAIKFFFVSGELSGHGRGEAEADVRLPLQEPDQGEEDVVLPRIPSGQSPK
jgi:hypothetical protein